LVTRDGKLLVATDPDRDQIYFIDAVAHELSHTRKLQAGDQPGRAVEDTAGRIHVALRGGHAIASLSREPEAAIERRTVCALPRGLAFDAAHDTLQVACAEGELVTVAAAPSGAITRTLDTERDVRDVIVRGEQLFLSRFRSAELLQLDSSGALIQRWEPPTSVRQETVRTDISLTSQSVESTATTAWRAIDVAGKGTALLHQRARVTEVSVNPGGYGVGGCGGGIVETSVTIGLEGDHSVSADISDVELAVDVAADPTGAVLAIAGPGNWGASGFKQVQLYSLTGSSPLNPFADASVRDANALAPAVAVAPSPCLNSAYDMPTLPGQVTAVAFVSADELAVQEREPAAISFIDIRSAKLLARLDLGQDSRFDTGHAMFHQRTRAGLSCASCHAEAGDDGHVWTFHAIGPRRTQSLSGGLLGTEPLHWNGDMRDFPTLVDEVFVGRMGGFAAPPTQVSALAQWIDRQPALAAPARDPAAAERGRTLFQSDAVGCATCHSGPHFTDNRSADVGTGALLQVPSLHGVAFRLPLMHDGCVTTLRGRFENACAGGDMHGHTSQLTAPQIDDLVAYLGTL
jgi:mono/diheme cytochrome c family protein